MKKTCEICGGPLPKTHRRFCARLECQRQREVEHKRQMRAWLKERGYSNRKAVNAKVIGHPDRRCQYPPNATKKCGKSLARTMNMFFCPEHARKVSDWVGIERD